MRICAIIPAFREAVRIAPVIEGIRTQVATVLVVDDGSPDATSDVARAAGAEVLRLISNQGKGAALVAGFRWAMERGFEAVLTLDADGQHDPADAAGFMRLWASERPALIVGCRMSDLERMPPLRRATNRLMSWGLSRMMGQYVPDTQCGYRLIRMDIAADLKVLSGRFASESEWLLDVAAGGERIRSVPIRTIYGTEQSKIHPWRDTLRFFRMLLRFRSRRKTNRSA